MFSRDAEALRSGARLRVPCPPLWVGMGLETAHAHPKRWAWHPTPLTLFRSGIRWLPQIPSQAKLLQAAM